ncbi:MAG: hypothetical protein CMH83_23035 [Nocardioides sp.]|nr:hypothetical protein [Nocardioides sp.]
MVTAPAEPDVLVISRVVLDSFEGPPPHEVLGGSGFWAAVGAATVADGVALTCRVGEDFEPHRRTMERLGIDTGALLVDGPTTPRTLITYPVGEHRHEEWLPDWAGHVAMRTMHPEGPEPARSARAYYVFRDHHPGFWQPVLDHVRVTGTPLMWEIPGRLCVPEPSSETLTVLAATDVLSINAEEADALVGPLSPVETVAALRALGPDVVALRRGGAGSVVADATGAWEVSPADVTVVDPTGGGNAWSGAFLAAWVRDHDVPAAAVAATGAAAAAIERTGPPVDRRTARQRAAALAATVTVRPLPSGPQPQSQPQPSTTRPGDTR